MITVWINACRFLAVIWRSSLFYEEKISVLPLLRFVYNLGVSATSIINWQIDRLINLYVIPDLSQHIVKDNLAVQALIDEGNENRYEHIKTDSTDNLPVKVYCTRVPHYA